MRFRAGPPTATRRSLASSGRPPTLVFSVSSKWGARGHFHLLCCFAYLHDDIDSDAVAGSQQNVTLRGSLKAWRFHLNRVGAGLQSGPNIYTCLIRIYRIGETGSNFSNRYFSTRNARHR